MKRALFGIVGAAVLGASSCTPQPCTGVACTLDSGQVTPETKVGFLYVGPVDLYGWTKSHDEGRLYVEQFTPNVKTFYREGVAPSAGPAVLDEFADAGVTIVFGTSFDFLSTSLNGPRRHPNLWTLNCAGFKTDRHAGNYMVRVEQSEYLAGMVAGRQTRTNQIGVIAALRIYEQVMHINAFTLGVRSVNPNATVHVRFVGNWFNPPMESAAVDDLVGANVDVIKNLTDTTVSTVKVGGLADGGTPTVWSIGNDNKDHCQASPNTCLVSAFYNWGPLYKKLVEEIQAGTYPENGRIDYFGQEDLDIGGISTFHAAVPQSVRDEVLAKQAQIRNKTFRVFQGPFNKADGGVYAASGTTLTDAQLLCTDTFVEGAELFNGPACQSDGDCQNTFAMMTCQQGRCAAPDLSGCTP